MSTEGRATEVARKRYDRIAPLYDFMEGGVDKFRFGKWRKMLWSQVECARVLEVGVGTGKNFPYYPKDAEITAIDFSERMLARAREKATKQKVRVHLQQMDVQHLAFEDSTFDTVAATFVFCSVSNPVRGLMEVARVCRPGGKVVLLEHVLSANPALAWVMNFANPLVVRISGTTINRVTVDNVVKSGLVLEQVTDLGVGIFKLIEARKR
jgi:phosphatidylethanolamine/phosphatidyl-N-methylethanolamine N-methyltransferase